MKPVGLVGFSPVEKESLSTIYAMGAIQIYDGKTCLYLYGEDSTFTPHTKLTKWIQIS